MGDSKGLQDKAREPEATDSDAGDLGGEGEGLGARKTKATEVVLLKSPGFHHDCNKLQCLESSAQKDHSINELMNRKSVYKTAPATQGLLIMPHVHTIKLQDI